MNKDSVLIVDDNQTTRIALKAFVEDSGLLADTCGDGKSALDIARESRHDIFLIDYRMPGMKGDAVTGLLRALRPDAFIIGFSIEAKERAFLDAGADAFLDKAHLLNKLIKVIRSCQRCRSAIEHDGCGSSLTSNSLSLKSSHASLLRFLSRYDLASHS